MNFEYHTYQESTTMCKTKNSHAHTLLYSYLCVWGHNIAAWEYLVHHIIVILFAYTQVRGYCYMKISSFSYYS